MSTARAATLLGPERLEIRKYPLPEVADETGGAMADVVVDVSGSPAALASSVAAVRKRGTLVLAGLVGTGREVPLEIDSLMWKEIRSAGRSRRLRAPAVRRRPGRARALGPPALPRPSPQEAHSRWAAQVTPP